MPVSELPSIDVDQFLPVMETLADGREPAAEVVNGYTLNQIATAVQNMRRANSGVDLAWKQMKYPPPPRGTDHAEWSMSVCKRYAKIEDTIVAKMYALGMKDVAETHVHAADKVDERIAGLVNPYPPEEVVAAVRSTGRKGSVVVTWMEQHPNWRLIEAGDLCAWQNAMIIRFQKIDDHVRAVLEHFQMIDASPERTRKVMELRAGCLGQFLRILGLS